MFNIFSTKRRASTILNQQEALEVAKIAIGSKGWALMNCLADSVAEYKDDRCARMVKACVITLVYKAKTLADKGKIHPKDTTGVDKPVIRLVALLRKALSPPFVTYRHDGVKYPKANDNEIDVMDLCDAVKEMEQACAKAIGQHLSEKTQQQVRDTFRVLGSMQFLELLLRSDRNSQYREKMARSFWTIFANLLQASKRIRRLQNSKNDKNSKVSPPEQATMA